MNSEMRTESDDSETDWAKAAVVVVGVALLVAGAYVSLRWMVNTWAPPAAAPAATTVPAPAAVAPAAEPAARAQQEPALVTSHPLDQLPLAASPFTLDDSDAALLEEIARLAGVRGVLQVLRPTEVVRHIVATVDALPRRQVPARVMPTRSVPGTFVAVGDGAGSFIGADNGERYARYVSLLNAINPASAAVAYRNFYSLFQRAYQELGYPDRYFNDRLVEAIDDSLATPEIPPPIRVEAPSVMWRYVDPHLEALSAGQKILLRMGQANAHEVKAWLAAFRKSVT